MNYLAGRSFSGFPVERRTSTPRRPDPFPFPSCMWIVDTAVHSLGKKSERIGNTHDDEFPVHESEQGIRRVTRDNWRVLAEPQRIELIHPIIIVRVGAS